MDIFVPDAYAQSIFSINYGKLKERHIKCLIFDLDNTLAPVEAKSPDMKIKNLIAKLEDMGFKIMIVSNSGMARVEPFKEGLNVDSAHSAMKPLKKKYKKILRTYNFKDNEIACIGDQLLTDIFGANRMGFTSILVNPISTNDFFFTKINRWFESKIMKRMDKRGVFTKGVYYD